MKNSNTQKKKAKLKDGSLLIPFAILASFFLIYQVLLLGPIEPILRIIFILLILGINLYFIRKNNSAKNKKVFTTLIILFIIMNITLSCTINYAYNLLSNINKSKITYSTSLITKKENDLEDIEDVVNKKIGIMNDPTSIDNYVLANEIIEDNNLKEDNEIKQYDDITDMLHDLYTNELDLIFISSNYKTMFQSIEEYQNIEQDVKVITTSEKSVKKEETIDYINSNGKNMTTPFTVLLMGVDSETDGLTKSASNGDSLILLSFNPMTLNTTMLSIPRDSYVPIACFKNNRENKITHAGWYGANCMINTIQNLLDIKIDYYVKINFKGVVSLVDTLGGVEVEVPKNLCTDNSNRTGKVCIKKGLQTLNGEEALVLARNRYDLARGDLDRSNNQQLLIKALLNKVKEINNIKQIETILKTVSNNMDTNMNTNQILSLYNIAKDIIKVGRNTNSDILPIEKLVLEGEGQMIYDPISKLTLWNYILNKESIKEVKNAIQNNLSKSNLSKEFSYSINDNYKSKVIGTGPFKETTKYTLLPNFIGENVEKVKAFAKKNHLKVEYVYEEKNSKYNDGDIIAQNYKKNTRIDKISTLKVTVLKKINSSIDSKTNCTTPDNKEKSCYLPSFIGKTKNDINDYLNNFQNEIKVTYNEVPLSLYPNKKIGTIVGQNHKVSTHLSKINELELTIIVK